jgi:hypothetical protein
LKQQPISDGATSNKHEVANDKTKKKVVVHQARSSKYEASSKQ